MQNKIFKLMAMLVLCLCFNAYLSSCGDKKDEPNSSNNKLTEKLQGTWTFDKMKITMLGQTIEMNRDQLVSETGFEYFYDDVLTFDGLKVNGLEYQLNGNKILLPWYESGNLWQTVSFSGKKMTLYIDTFYEGVAIKMWIIYSKTRSGECPLPVLSGNHSFIEVSIPISKLLFMNNNF